MLLFLLNNPILFGSVANIWMSQNSISFGVAKLLKNRKYQLDFGRIGFPE